MTLHTHLSFGGNCEEAFRFYQHCLRGKIEIMLTWGDSPMAANMPPAMHHKICHASLAIGSHTLVGADVSPDQYRLPQGFQVLLSLDDPAEAERIFHALAQDGIIQMPLQKTFWSPGFGVLTDRFGVPWEINCERAD